MSVSYTHLDVYKRQLNGLSNGTTEFVEHVTENSNITGQAVVLEELVKEAPLSVEISTEEKKSKDIQMAEPIEEVSEVISAEPLVQSVKLADAVSTVASKPEFADVESGAGNAVEPEVESAVIANGNVSESESEAEEEEAQKDLTRELVLDESSLLRLEEELLAKSEGLNIERLEIITAKLMEIIWNYRAQWDKSSAINDLLLAL